MPHAQAFVYCSQDRKEQRKSAPDVCTPFVLGRCRFGDGCRFSHDVPAYLATKAAELPGCCPFTAADACPYGGMAQPALSVLLQGNLHVPVERCARLHLRRHPRPAGSKSL